MKKGYQKGITMISLVVTIIVILILAGISISMLTGDDGTINDTITAKEEAEIRSEKELLIKSANESRNKDKYGDIQENNLQKSLNLNAGNGKTELKKYKMSDGYSIDYDLFEVTFTDSKRIYM